MRTRRWWGSSPAVRYQLQLKANAVDVNVHPAKTEVKFLYERKVFDGVYYTVLAALNGEKRHPDLVFPEQKRRNRCKCLLKHPLLHRRRTRPPGVDSSG